MRRARFTPYPFLFVLLAICARLPFLLTGKIPFDSDEAVEGLMARHVLNGELPAFFWGQAFKGVPEVYAAAGAFAFFGSSVTVLKSVTLAFFAAFVGFNFVLVDKIAGRWMAVVSCLLLIVGPPALVFWSLDASAEYVVIMLIGTVFLLLCLRLEEHRAEGREQRAKVLLAAIGFVVGLGFWVHQLFIVYLLPALVIFMFQRRWWTQRSLASVGVAARVLAAIATFYFALGVIAFFSGGFSFHVGSLTLGAHAPQKMLRVAIAVASLACVIHVLTIASRDALRQHVRRYWPLAAGFLLGYLPVVLYSAFVEPARSPARSADLRQMIKAAPDIFGNVIPILAGFKIATTERLGIPLAALTIVVAALAAYLVAIAGRVGGYVRLRPDSPDLASDFFPIFVVFVPFLFIVSGAYIDTQSYRYLIPYYAGISVALAAGSVTLAKGDKRIASMLVAMMLIVFGLQQFVWYQKLRPDMESIQVLECLKSRGIRGGTADYWTSYKLTFLSNEQIIFAPVNGVDRYPAFTEFVGSLPEHQRVANLSECVVSR